MKYNEFKAKVRNYPFFRSNIFVHFTNKVSILRRQMSEWAQKGYILQLKRGFYILRPEDQAHQVSRLFIANQLYPPSYISLETALSYYGFIPEKTESITSVSTKKTQQFTNALGTFTYQHIKPTIFNHCIAKQDEFGNTFLIASPEKAMLDFLYFKSFGLKNSNENIFRESFRFQHLNTLNKDVLRKIGTLFRNKKLLKLADQLIKFMEL